MKQIAAMIGLASKAGQLIAGTAAVEAALKKGRVKMVICAADLAPRTLKKMEDLCHKNQVGFLKLGTRLDLGKWSGYPERGVLGIVSSQFTGAIRSLFNEGGGLS
ncbi:MAG: L7Ae/L30e/S12e/Gadd45 family ribosomal protein [Firmicutes bacterium]|nr:L7Ae/L30e/S12e/Gadd45 family ribosomal protein [Bacillota bacterium]